MNQLGKNLVYTLCVVATLLVILGLKKKFERDHESTLLSQSSDTGDTTAPRHTNSSPRPRVLQAKPITQRDRSIVSPTSPRYSESNGLAPSTNGSPVSPIPTANTRSMSAPRALDAPELVGADKPIESPAKGHGQVTDDEGSESSEAATAIETPTVPVATRPLPEFVLTDAEDSFWSISEEVYGSGAYYRALFRHNETNVLRPDQLRAGVQVRTPPLEVLQELFPSEFPALESSAPRR